MNFGLVSQYEVINFEELSSNDIEIVSGGSGGDVNTAGLIAGVLGAGAAMTGTYTLVPGPHVPVAGAITAVLGLGAAAFGLYAAFA